jgi:hypothetical protein
MHMPSVRQHWVAERPWIWAAWARPCAGAEHRMSGSCRDLVLPAHIPAPGDHSQQGFSWMHMAGAPQRWHPDSSHQRGVPAGQEGSRRCVPVDFLARRGVT